MLVIFPALLQVWGREEGAELGKEASCREKAGNNAHSSSQGAPAEAGLCPTQFLTLSAI